MTNKYKALVKRLIKWMIIVKSVVFQLYHDKNTFTSNNSGNLVIKEKFVFN
jgi:hypothetical protein